MEVKPEQVQKIASELQAEANKLRPGAKSVEWKGFLAVLLCNLVNPIIVRYLGVGIPEDVMLSLIGLTGALIAARTYVKR